MIRGFDASSVQGVVPFAALAAQDLRFGIFKAQQGNDGFDPSFVANVKGALEVGIEPFPYCFAYPLPEKAGKVGRHPREQARIFVDRTIGASKTMVGRPFFLDLEWPEVEEWSKWGCSAQQISEWCAECADEVHILTGVRPILYTYPYWWAAVSKADVSWAAQYQLWLAAYTTGGQWPRDGQRPRVPKPWIDWCVWQFDGNGGLRLPNGVDADFCMFNGDEDALRALAHVARKDRPASAASPLGPAAVDEVKRF